MPVAGRLSLGVINGEANEHVYNNEVIPGSRYQVSRLDWELKGVVMGGGSGSVRLLDKWTLNGGLWLALTQGSGEMEDYDWLDPRAPDWTHYSLSEVDVTSGYILDLNAAWDLVEWNGLEARALAGYKQDGWTWEDRGVLLLYPEFNYIPQDLDGVNMINYEQEFRMPYLGVSADWRGNGIAISGHVIYSPYLWAKDWDEHVTRNLYFRETFAGGNMLGIGCEIRYDFPQGPVPGLFLSAALDYQKIDLIIGDMEVLDATTGEFGGEKDAAGIENEYLAISLGVGKEF